MRPPTNRACLQRGARRFGCGTAVMALFLSVIGPTAAQDAPAAAPADAGAAKPAPPDPAADLAVRRDSTASELEALSKTITLSRDRSEALEKTIAEIDKSNETLREALVDSAAKRQELERRIADGERKLGDLRVKEDVVRRSLRARRGLLAEVLAALQRMGRNPPPAILVTPEDALGSVRSAILLGAVVPEIREQTDSLVADLKALADIRSGIAREREELTAAMTARLEEERRMSMLVAEKEKLRQRNAADLAVEQRKAEELALQAGNLEGLISSLENEISSVREAAAAARAEEEERRRMSAAEREAARELARSAVPDKNRIAPAYVFSELRERLAYPVAGSLVRRFGDADGTGHSLQGIMLETNAGALVTTPADGWIVYAGSFRSYGQMIILNAGDGYHIVLAGMENVSVRPGQFVVAGEPVAAMGAKRVASAAALALETDRPTLYIEFRKDGKPVDSRPWWTAAEVGRARNDT
ncbi:murein hydrolase activator EnvC family protein [Sinorhizobium prairiense]|uniref:murein hydrolase activator EnvC family protein n=1 Tax=unclassified Sinorhizobium TaxID=2613772 RepID=UPI0023D8B0EE|nr:MULTISPECIES: murein hydrolase activator EnvC [unclassified Sinorhizobium]WEJ09969.1 murein hydrolase activator EnvC [Sinorhizobium sp. M103]WEJ15480.1 murein hydrolase activator EnvC [Sinorhizobium sp. K101]WEJ36930.1 murein hydrolase activator EnvC [Sinorhizobium sp. C101]